MSSVYSSKTKNAHGWTILLAICEVGEGRYVSVKTEIPLNPENTYQSYRDFYLRDGAFQWCENNSVISPKICAEFGINQLDNFNRALQEFRYQERLDKVLTNYRKNQSETPSPEHLAEMRANFPAGTTLVDVVSGRKTQI